MGIPSYFSYIVRKHRKILINYQSKRMAIHNLYMDCNSLIYDSIHELENNNNVINDIENTIITMVCDKIKHYIKILSPQKNIFIAFDGVAPIAKLEQQKNRRYKSWLEKDLQSKMGVTMGGIFDTVSITPGTEFMKKLDNKIHSTFENTKQHGVDKIIISSSNEAGEGEHKIYKYIRDNKSEHKNYTTVIYGLDADLIMLTLNHLYIAESMYLFRETPHFIKSLDKSLNPNSTYLMDIPMFADSLAIDLNDNNNPETQDKHNRIFDYILLCFFMGNDFLPHFPALNIRTTGIDRIMDAYKTVIGTTNKNITDGDKIIWNNLRKVILLLANMEDTLFLEEYQIRDKQARGTKTRTTDLKDRLNSIPMLDRSIEMYINPTETGWEDRYYQCLFDFEIDDDRRKEICVNYLEGLEWTLKYYTTGCSNWRWSYKYNYPPLLKDLIKYIPAFEVEFLDVLPPDPVLPLVQLSYVIPRKSLYLVPRKLQEILLSKYSENYRENYEIEWAFCRYFWEAHVKFSEININKLEELVDSL
tara:strand:- start:1210 stop:2799 length:1590 start_codon:yes stop_codon:yes gene_type:complete